MKGVLEGNVRLESGGENVGQREMRALDTIATMFESAR